eukprot:1157275-Pelagomonas_calceolata.AAC.4
MLRAGGTNRNQEVCHSAPIQLVRGLCLLSILPAKSASCTLARKQIRSAHKSMHSQPHPLTPGLWGCSSCPQPAASGDPRSTAQPGKHVIQGYARSGEAARLGVEVGQYMRGQRA